MPRPGFWLEFPQFKSLGSEVYKAALIELHRPRDGPRRAFALFLHRLAACVRFWEQDGSDQTRGSAARYGQRDRLWPFDQHKRHSLARLLACKPGSGRRGRRFPRQQVAETGVAARSDVGAMVGDGAATGLSDWL